MNGQLIIDVLSQRLLPIIKKRDFNILPSAQAAVANSKYYSPIFPYALHTHSFFEWIWCIEEHAFLQIEEQVYRLEIGDFCLLPPGKVHVDVYAPSQENYQVLWCAYYNGTIGAHLHTYSPTGRLGNIDRVSGTAPPFTALLLGSLQYELKTKDLHYQPTSASFIEALTHLMLRSFETSQQHKISEFVPGKVAIKVNQYLNERFNKPLPLAEIARAMHISRNYLVTLYKQETGKTIGQALLDIRLEHAKQLLLETELTVQEVANSVGYTSPEHFGRIFLKHVGVTPGTYGK